MNFTASIRRLPLLVLVLTVSQSAFGQESLPETVGRHDNELIDTRRQIEDLRGEIDRIRNQEIKELKDAIDLLKDNQLKSTKSGIPSATSAQTKENGTSASPTTKLIDFELGYIPLEITGQWYVDSTKPKGEGSSIHSPETADNASSYFEITEQNVGRVSFDYYVSAEVLDTLHFRINGKVRGTYVNTPEWEHVDILLRPGDYVFRWSYDKDGSAARLDDTVWVDNIEFFFVRLE